MQVNFFREYFHFKLNFVPEVNSGNRVEIGYKSKSADNAGRAYLA